MAQARVEKLTSGGVDEPQERSGVGRRLPHREGDMPYYFFAQCIRGKKNFVTTTVLCSTVSVPTHTPHGAIRLGRGRVRNHCSMDSPTRDTHPVRQAACAGPWRPDPTPSPHAASGRVPAASVRNGLSRLAPSILNVQYSVMVCNRLAVCCCKTSMRGAHSPRAAQRMWPALSVSSSA